MSTTPEATSHHSSRKFSILLPLRAIQNLSFHYETPCTVVLNQNGYLSTSGIQKCEKQDNVNTYSACLWLAVPGIQTLLSNVRFFCLGCSTLCLASIFSFFSYKARSNPHILFQTIQLRQKNNLRFCHIFKAFSEFMNFMTVNNLNMPCCKLRVHEKI